MKLGLQALLNLVLCFFLSAVLAFADHALNINTADKETLMTLSGIGEVKAEAIIEYRQTNGSFASIDEIKNVNGIGEATYNNIKDHITVSGGSSPAPSPSPAPPSASPSPSPSPNPSSSPSAPKPKVYVDAGPDRVVIAGAEVEFQALAYDNTKALVKSVRFRWNFGDGATAQGALVRHEYAHPGRYAVVVTFSGDSGEISDRLTITAESAALRVSLVSGSVAIENEGKNDVDLSGWIIHSGKGEFFFPEDSLLLAEETIHVSEATLGFRADSSTELRYPDGALAYKAGEIALVAPTSTSPVETLSAGSEAAESEAIPLNTEEVEEEDGAEVSSASSSQIAAAAVGGSWKWWTGALALAFVGAGSMYVAKRYSKREWSIIEDTSE